MVRRVLGLLGSTAALLATAGAGTLAAAPAAPAVNLGPVGPVPLARMISHVSYPTPPTTGQCEHALKIACYGPSQFQTAYDLQPLYRKGDDGSGQTIVIVDSFGYQFIRDELNKFDKSFGLPAPPSFKIIHPAGDIPPYDPNKRPTMFGWAIETSLDVEYAHAMAPGANILLVETPVAETLGSHGFPAIVEAENYVVDHHLGNVVTQSFGAPEKGFSSPGAIMKLRSAYVNAANNGVTMLTGSGDAGATGARTLDAEGFASSFFLSRQVAWPASDPLVTAVGGTQLHLNNRGQRLQPDTVWNDTNLEFSPAASGGGRSTVFSRPSYQNSVSGQVGTQRGVPDISMSAAVDGSALVYLNAELGAGPAGFYLIGGTSESSPEFAGIVAIADQVAGRGLGLINPYLYQMAGAHDPGIVDVTAGTNTVTFPQGANMHTVKGFDAVNGYDLSSGVGTIDGARFVPDLVAVANSQ